MTGRFFHLAALAFATMLGAAPMADAAAPGSSPAVTLIGWNDSPRWHGHRGWHRPPPRGHWNGGWHRPAPPRYWGGHGWHHAPRQHWQRPHHRGWGGGGHYQHRHWRR